VCRRRRYLEYHLLGHGIEKTKMGVRKAAGLYIHVGIEYLLKGFQVEQACELAGSAYMAMCATRGLELEPQEDAYQVAMEQKCLVENAVRGFALEAWPAIQSKGYTLLNAEEEHEWEWSELTWMWRVDAMLANELGEPCILSIKTVDTVDEAQLARTIHSMQAISDPAAAGAEIGRTPETLVQYISTGARRKNARGQYEQHSPLCRGYHHRVGDRYAPGRTYRSRSGDRKRLGGEWEAFPVWQSAQWTGATWVDFLKEQGALRDIYPHYFINPPSPKEVGDWLEDTMEQESALARMRRLVNPFGPEGAWPMYRHSCDGFSPCPFQSICFGNVSLDDPLASGEFRERIPNHEAERKLLPKLLQEEAES
jgi:hypothetical protein